MAHSSSPKLPRIERLERKDFTYSYAQPPDYRFCQDSVIFPKWLADRLDRAKIGDEFRTLDVCAGCGVIGLELAHHVPELRQLDFLEVQEAFREPFMRNLELAGRTSKAFRFLAVNYSQLLEPPFAGHYDLIVGNPPYFFPGDGKLTPSEIKNRCRFFMDSNFETLIAATTTALRPRGEAFLLVKPGDKHGRDNLLIARREARLLGADVEAIADIRGTWVLRISR